MYSVLFASVCILFAKAKVSNKLIVLSLSLYIVILLTLQNLKYLTFQDYLNYYTITTSMLALLLFLYTEMKLAIKCLALVTVVPQLFYLYLLHHPYAISARIPITFLQSADVIFCWGVLVLTHEQVVGWDFKNQTTRDYLVNLGIFTSLLIF